MAYLYRARDRDRQYVFETCPQAPGQCNGDTAAHHVYTWEKSAAMSPAQMVRELVLLESHNAPSIPDIVLPLYEGRLLESLGHP